MDRSWLFPFLGSILLASIIVSIKSPTPGQKPENARINSQKQREKIAQEREQRFKDQQQQQIQRGGVNMANYSRLSAGMTYEQVVEIIGKEGTEMSRVESAEYPTIMYAWEVGGFSTGNMSVTFQNGGLVSKAQFGLP